MLSSLIKSIFPSSSSSSSTNNENSTSPSPSPNNGTILSATLALFVSAAGAGLLSYPYAVMHQGILINVILTIGFALLTIYTDIILVQTSHIFSPYLTIGTYEDLARTSLGYFAYVTAILSVVLGIFGALIGFMIIIGDMSIPVLEHICSNNDSLTCMIVTNRWFIVLMVAIFIALPLSSRKTIHGLVDSSIFASLTVLVVGILVIIHGSNNIHGNWIITNNEPDPSAPNANDTSSSSSIILLRWSFIGWMLGMPISIFSLGNHTQVVPVFLGCTNITKEKFFKPISYAVGTCLLLYLSTGLLGYISFRDTTKGDVLINFPITDAVSDTAKALLAIHVLLAYPLLLWPCRKSLAAVCSVFGQQYINNYDMNNFRYKYGKLLLFIANSPLTLASILVLTTSILSIAFPQVAIVFGLIGSTCATYQIYIIPAWMLYKYAQAYDGTLLTNMNTDNNEIIEQLSLLENRGDSTFSSYPQHENTNTTVELDSTNGTLTNYQRNMVWANIPQLYKDNKNNISLINWLPTKSWILYIHSYCLFIIGTLVILIGTGTYIYTTWIRAV